MSESKGQVRFQANYFPQYPHTAMFMPRFVGDDKKQSLALRIIELEREIVRFSKFRKITLFEAVHEHLKGNPLPLKKMASFSGKKYLSAMCGFEAKLLIALYADLLGKDLCLFICRHFIDDPVTAKYEQTKHIPYILYLSGNTWATRLAALFELDDWEALADYQNDGILRLPPTPIILSRADRMSRSYDYKIRRLGPFYYDNKLGYYIESSLKHDPFIPIVRQKCDDGDYPAITSPTLLHLKDWGDPDRLYAVLQSCPFLNHDFGKWAFPLFRKLYRFCQTGEAHHPFSRPMLRQWYCVMRRNRLSNERISLIPVALRLLWDMCRHPDKRIDLASPQYRHFVRELGDERIRDSLREAVTLLEYIPETATRTSLSDQDFLMLIQSILMEEMADLRFEYLFINQKALGLEWAFGKMSQKGVPPPNILPRADIRYLHIYDDKHLSRFMWLLGIPLFNHYTHLNW